MRKGSPSTTSVALSAKGAKSAKSAGRSSSCKARPVYFAVSDEPADRPTAMMAYNGNFSRVPPPTGLDPPPVPTVAGRRGTSYFVFPAELDGAQGGATVDEHTGALRSELFVPGGVFFLELLYGDFGSSNPAGRGRGRGKSDRRMADSHCSCNGGVGSVAGTSTRSWSMVEAVDPDSQMLMEALRASSDVVIEQMLESARQMDVSEPTGEPVLSQGPMPLEDQAAGTAASGQQPAVPLEPAPTEQPEAAAPPSGISSPWSPTQPSTPRSQAEPKTAAPPVQARAHDHQGDQPVLLPEDVQELRLGTGEDPQGSRGPATQGVFGRRRALCQEARGLQARARDPARHQPSRLEVVL